MKLLALLWLTSLAQAQPLTRLLTVADDAFAHGFYSDALGAYQDAFLATREPTLLLKIGSSYEHLSDYANAALSYRRYLAEEPALSAGERADLQTRAAALEARLQPSPSPAPPPPAAIVIAAAPPPRHLGLRRASIAGAAITAAAILAASGVTIGAASAFSQLGSDCRGRNPGCNDGAANQVTTLNHAADALWAVAAAGAIVTLTLELVRRR